MASIERTKFVKAGDWRTLESGWNASFSCFFRGPVGAQIKIRYGAGWVFGRDSQKQTLDGTPRSLNVGRASLVFARAQIKVQRDVEVTYIYAPIGP
jgi:hypothetical protein